MTNETSSQNQFYELSYYTLSHPDKSYFIHQHIVDAYQAQTADQNTKPIGLLFSLVGLYLYVEKKYTGREVQLAHMTMAKQKKEWPEITLPDNRGKITVQEVLAANPGKERDLAIKDWCHSVWETYYDSHVAISILTKTGLNIN